MDFEKMGKGDEEKNSFEDIESLPMKFRIDRFVVVGVTATTLDVALFVHHCGRVFTSCERGRIECSSPSCMATSPIVHLG